MSLYLIFLKKKQNDKIFSPSYYAELIYRIFTSPILIFFISVKPLKYYLLSPPKKIIYFQHDFLKKLY